MALYIQSRSAAWSAVVCPQKLSKTNPPSDANFRVQLLLMYNSFQYESTVLMLNVKRYLEAERQIVLFKNFRYLHWLCLSHMENVSSHPFKSWFIHWIFTVYRSHPKQAQVSSGGSHFGSLQPANRPVDERRCTQRASLLQTSCERRSGAAMWFSSSSKVPLNIKQH